MERPKVEKELRTLLVVEDNNEIRQYLKSKLATIYNVFDCDNGQGNGVKAINLDFNGTEVTHTKGNDAITKNMKVAITLDAGISSNIYPQPDRFSFQINGIDLGVTYVYLPNGNVKMAS